MEDRNGSTMRKMKRFINVFSKDEEPAKEEEDTGNSEPRNDLLQTDLTVQNKPKPLGRQMKNWLLIRKSLNYEKEESVDSPDVKYF